MASLAATLALVPTAAFAHGSERGFVMLLPTGHVMAGGALAVAASFLVAALLPAGAAPRIAAARLPLGALRPRGGTVLSVASFAVLLALVAMGLIGTQDPLENLLPLTVWTLWWVGMPLLSALFGDLWAALNPIVGPYRLADRALGGRLAARARPDLVAPLGHLPAIVLFAAFAWFELIDLAPDNPQRLARAVLAYLALSFVLIALVGETAWRGRIDPFSVFFRFLAGLSPLAALPLEGARRRLALVVPGAEMLSRPALPLTGVAFVLITLSSVSFDGLSKTFFWLGLIGINPLEFPGRSAVVGANTAGLLATFAVLAAVFAGAVALGWRLAGRPGALAGLLGRTVLSIVPISIAFHGAHYLTALLVNGQYALIAASDPFGLGWDLLGLGHAHVTTSFLNTASGAALIFGVQTALIVGGHVLAVLLAHLLLAAREADRRRLLLLELPLAAAMVLYTVFGLWLLSTPTAG